MNRYIVRPIVGESAKMQGQVGYETITVRAENAGAARTQGAKMLGLPESRVEVHDANIGAGNELIINMPREVAEQAALKRGDQDTGFYGHG